MGHGQWLGDTHLHFPGARSCALYTRSTNGHRMSSVRDSEGGRARATATAPGKAQAGEAAPLAHSAPLGRNGRGPRSLSPSQDPEAGMEGTDFHWSCAVSPFCATPGRVIGSGPPCRPCQRLGAHGWTCDPWAEGDAGSTSLALGHGKTPRRRPTEGPQAAMATLRVFPGL